jgi:transcriptional regulator with XRE-family HTH domain
MSVPDPFVSLVLRQARRSADLSQRQLAAAAGIPPSSLGAYEAARRDIGFSPLVRLLHACGWEVAFQDRQGELVEVLVDDPLRDAGERRYPAHLDVRETGPYRVGGDGDGFRAWWGDSTPGAWGLPPRPERTYDLGRLQRDRRRRRDAGEPDPWSR